MGSIVANDTDRVLVEKGTKRVIRQILAMAVCVMVTGTTSYRMSASDERYKKTTASDGPV